MIRLDQVRSLRVDEVVASEPIDLRGAESAVLVDETVALRRCALYRSGFKGVAVSYPASLLSFCALAEWARHHRVTVDVSTPGELAAAVGAGIDARQIVMHARDGAARYPIHAARFVLSSGRQIAALADDAERPQQVVIDPAGGDAATLTSHVLARRQLDLIGLHCRLDDRDDPIGAMTLRRSIAEMAWIRRTHGVLTSRLSVAGLNLGQCTEPWVLRRVAEAIYEVVGEECARHRYPRPALTVAPSRSALLPASSSAAHG